MKIFKRIVAIFLVFIIVSAVSFIIYASFYYEAFEEAYTIGEEATIIDDNIYFDGDRTDVGFIIYPGAKVDEMAYSSLAKNLSDRGYTTAIVAFPLHFAFFDINAADEVINARPNIEKWVIIGHSLGGTMAGYYTTNTTNSISGLVFLASYTTAKINTESIYIYGSNDTVLSMDKIPLGDNTHIIEGGNHANFALYGPQKSDGVASITTKEQVDITTKLILEFISD